MELTENNKSERNRVLLLSTSLLDDRKLIYSESINMLADEVDVSIWATSRRNSGSAAMWAEVRADVYPFPEVLPFREFPFNFLRKVNNAAWDVRVPTAARRGVHRLIRSSRMTPLTQFLRAFGRLLGRLCLHRLLERGINDLCRSYPRSPEAASLLQKERPSLVVSTCPARFEEPAIIATAQRMGIPTAVMIHSFDNLTTKDRMLYDFEAYLVWSEKMKEELTYLYPNSRKKPIYVVGAQQFDLFRQPRMQLSREEFCANQGLDPSRPIVVYALGSPRLFPGEWEAPLQLARAIGEPRFHGAQLVLRPHPNFDDRELHDRFKDFSHVTVQKAHEASEPLAERFHDEEAISEWANTFRHANVVVNMSSTATIDAALFDTPVVNLDFDPNTSGFSRELINEVNHVWEHFKPVAESGALWLADSHDSIAEGVAFYLDKPAAHRDERARIAKAVCGFTDGKCGQRMAKAVFEILETVA